MQIIIHLPGSEDIRLVKCIVIINFYFFLLTKKHETLQCAPVKIELDIFLVSGAILSPSGVPRGRRQRLGALAPSDARLQLRVPRCHTLASSRLPWQTQGSVLAWAPQSHFCLLYDDHCEALGSCIVRLLIRCQASCWACLRSPFGG